MSSRRGMGIAIVIAVATVIILGILLVHHNRSSSWAANEVGILVAGERAEWIASSAIEECKAKLRLAINDGETSVFSKFRQTLGPGDGGDFSLADELPLTHLQKVFDEGLLLPGASLESLQVKVLKQSVIDSTVYERRGYIQFLSLASVSAGLLRKPRRTVEVVLPYTIALTSPPRPFCTYGFFLGELRGFTNPVVANALRDDLVKEHEEMWSQLEAASGGVPDNIAKLYLKLTVKLVPRGDGELAKRLPEEGDAALYGLSRDGLAMDLNALDVEADVRRTWTQARGLARSRQLAYDRVVRDKDSIISHKRFIAALEAEGKVVGQGLWNFWAFSRAFRILPWTHAAYGPLAAAYDRFDAAYWDRRIQYVVKREGRERTINEAWARFLRLHPYPKGVIKIDNPSTTLTLTGRLKTASILVIGRGGVIVKDFNAEESREERCTIVVMGGSVQLSGRIHCTLLLGRGEMQPRAFSMAPGTHLVGGFMAVSLPSHHRLNGVLYRRQKYSSGEGGVLSPTHLHAVMRPVEVYRKVGRR